jgi:hypothetical protein
LFILLSTGLLFTLAGAVGCWSPARARLAWAVALFGVVHAVFLVVARPGGGSGR